MALLDVKVISVSETRTCTRVSPSTEPKGSAWGSRGMRQGPRTRLLTTPGRGYLDTFELEVKVNYLRRYALVRRDSFEG